MRALIYSLIGDQRGATAIEYGLLAGLLALGIVGGLNAFTNSFRNVYAIIGNQTQAAASRN